MGHNKPAHRARSVIAPFVTLRRRGTALTASSVAVMVTATLVTATLITAGLGSSPAGATSPDATRPVVVLSASSSIVGQAQHLLGSQAKRQVVRSHGRCAVILRANVSIGVNARAVAHVLLGQGSSRAAADASLTQGTVSGAQAAATVWCSSSARTTSQAAASVLARASRQAADHARGGAVSKARQDAINAALAAARRRLPAPAPVSTGTAPVSSGAAPTAPPTTPAPTTPAPTTPAPTTPAPTTPAPTTPAPISSGSPAPTTSGSPVTQTVSASTPMPTGNLPGWRQVYAEDFNGSTLDTNSVWSAYNNWAPGSNPNTGWWSASHAIVGNGMLTLKGSVDLAANPQGRVVTAGVGLWKLPAQTYGKYEILARMDQCPDVKYAWLLWPYSGKWPDDGEIDFAEDEGGNRAQTTASLLFKNASGNADALPQDRINPVGGMSAWHTIGVEWTPTAVRYTMDGQYWGQAKTSHIPSNPMTLVLQTEGKLAPSQVTLGGGSCNAQIGWVTQYAMQ